MLFLNISFPAGWSPVSKKWIYCIPVSAFFSQNIRMVDFLLESGYNCTSEKQPAIPSRIW
jgi:hypothetical protein